MASPQSASGQAESPVARLRYRAATNPEWTIESTKPKSLPQRVAGQAEACYLLAIR
jgi:hypothetical protein